MNKHIKLFEQFVNEGVTFDKFIDIEKSLAGPNGSIKTSLIKTFTFKDSSGDDVIADFGSGGKDIQVFSDTIEIAMSDEGFYTIGETLSASLDLSSLKGLSLEMAKAQMGPDFKNLKIEGGILTFDYIIPSDFIAKNKKYWGGGTKITVMDKFREALKKSAGKSLEASKDIPQFCIIIPCPSIEFYNTLSICLIFNPGTEVSK